MSILGSSKTEPVIELSTGVRRRGLLFLGLAVAAAGLATGIQGGLNVNFLVEEFHISSFQQGLLESVREICGITALLILAILAGLGEPLVAACMLLLVAVGIGSYAFVPNYFWVVAMSLVWSQGLHVWMPLPQSMTLALAEKGRSGHRLGQIQAASAGGVAGGLVLVLVLDYFGVAMRPMYIVAAVVAVCGAAACLGIPRKIKTPSARLIFRKKYGLYYLLCFLEGWRKQIFLAFSAFLLVKVHGTELQTILLLMLAVQVIGYFTSARVGRLIDRIGERKILAFYYTCLMFFFVGYAVIPNAAALYALYVIDCAFFVFVMAQVTYVRRIAPQNEHTPTLSAGVAMNHIASVTMPLVGGLIWIHWGYQWTFLVGALAAAVSIFVALRLPEHRPEDHVERIPPPADLLRKEV